MKYILDNKSYAIKTIEAKDIKGLEIKSKKANPVKAQKVLIVDQELKNIYIGQKIKKKLSEIIAKMQYILENPDADEGDTVIVLGEIQRLKGIMINKYQEHLKSEEYKAFLTKICYIEQEFKMKYNTVQIYKEMLMENFEETKNKGR